MQAPARRGHGRAASGHERRQGIVRRSTKGPLDAEDVIVDEYALSRAHCPAKKLPRRRPRAYTAIQPPGRPSNTS